MTTELLLPRGKILRPKPPSRICLDMAFAVGAGAELKDKSRYRSAGAIITATWGDGLHGRCLDFNLANPDYVDIPAAHTQLDFTTEDFSIITRIEPDQVALRSTIFMRGKPNADGYSYRIDAGGQLVFLTWQLAAFQITRGNAAAIAVDTWYTIGMSRAGASVRVYINGVDDVTAAGAHIDPATCARNAVLGLYGQEIINYPFDGKIEFQRIFGVALTASEHLAYHRALS